VSALLRRRFLRSWRPEQPGSPGVAWPRDWEEAADAAMDVAGLVLAAKDAEITRLREIARNSSGTAVNR
jgi:hypothetical protein